MSDTAAYRDALVAMLDVSGAHAIEILRGEAPLDPVILLSAVNAAATLEGLPSRNVLAAVAQHPDVFEQSVEALDLAPRATDLDGPDDEREERLERLVTLGTLALYARPRLREDLRGVLDRNFVLTVCAPARMAGLEPLATFLSDTLDLAPGHLARPLLEAIRDAPLVAATAFEPRAFERVLERGRPNGGVIHLDDYRLRTTRVAQLRAAADGGAPNVPAEAWMPVFEHEEFSVEVAELTAADHATTVFLSVQTRPGSPHDLTRVGEPDGPRVTLTHADGTPAVHSAPRCSARVWTVQLGPSGPWKLVLSLRELTFEVTFHASAGT